MTKRKPSKIYMRVKTGCLEPTDIHAERQLREKKFKLGDVVSVIVRKLRNPRFNRLVHRIGQLCVEHIEEFKYMDAHAVLKRIQLEGNIYCEEVAVKPIGAGLIPVAVIASLKPVLELFGLKLTENGLLIVRIPISLSFETMDEAEYYDAAQKICRFISENYWQGVTPEGIEEMTESMIDYEAI